MRLRTLVACILLLGCLAHAGKEGGEAGFSFGEGWELREDLPVLFKGWRAKEYGELPAAGVYQSGARLRLAFQRAPGAGEVVASVAFDPRHFFIKGMPVLVGPATGERREIDYRFEDEKIVFEGVPVGPGLRTIEMEVCSRKLRNRGELTIEDKLKQARTIRRIRPRTASWSPLAPGQIIAQETLRPIVCHGGYDTEGVKTAVVWANGGKLTGEFQLLDAERNRQHPAPQPVVYTGRLTDAGTHIWGGRNYVADFTDFRKPGLYFVRLVVEETKEVADSLVFPIRRGRYLELATKAADWFTYQRCGTEVPGFHRACHTKDAVVKLDGTKVDVTGGWHDAGDYGKWIGPGTMGIMALTTLHEDFGSEIGAMLGGMPRYVNEAAWEAKYIAKGYWDGAFHAGFTPDFEDVCTWLGAPENEPPRVVEEAEMLENRYGYCQGPGITWTSSSLARCGRLLGPYDEETAKRCLAIAREVHDIDRAVDLEKPEYEEKRNSYLWLQTGLLMSSIELHLATGDEAYAREAGERAERILELQAEDGSFHLDRAKESEKYVECRFHLFALHEFLRRFPESGLAPRIVAAFRRWADLNMEFAGLSSFGLIGGRVGDGSVRNLKYEHGNRRIGAFAWGLATTAVLTGDRKYLTAAERQIQWITGFNPADVSMMAGVGRGPGCYHHRYCFMEGCEHGIVPGGILNGIVSGEGLEKATYLGDTDTKNFVIARAPIDYPIIDTDVWGWTYAYRSNEYWARNNAWFVLGSAQVERALRTLR